MGKTGHWIKSVYSKIIHITSLLHDFDKITETVHKEYLQVDKIVSDVKKKFQKAPSRIQTFENKVFTLA